MGAEGKTFLSMQTMRTLSDLGKRVVLIDADLRRSTIAAAYRLQYVEKERYGITHFLAGKCEMEDIIYATDLKGAFFVPVGHAADNSLALLNSRRFQQLLDHIGPNVDYVIVDAPPIGMIVDALEIAKSCDGAVLVVGYNQVRRRELLNARQQIEKAGCDVLGTVLNNVPVKVYDKDYQDTGIMRADAPPIGNRTNDVQKDRVDGNECIYRYSSALPVRSRRRRGYKTGDAEYAACSACGRNSRHPGDAAYCARDQAFSVELYKAQIEEADAFAKAKNLDLRVYSGAEILYGFQTRRFLSEHRLPTLADSGKVLLEFCLDVKYPEIENAVLTVLRTGHLPVLAHIERYPCLMQKARGLRLLKKQYDVSCQVNADSVLRNWNSVMSGAMKRAIADGTIDFVASDAHSPRSGAYAMQKAYAKLEQHFGADLADRLTGNHKTVEWFGNL
jgi:capsular exopolysaccharide synthesis family protein